MKRLSLTQYEKSAPQDITVAERDALLQCVPELDIIPEVGSTGQYVLRPGKYIGSVRFGDLTVTIEPKIAVSRLLFLISYGLDRFRWYEPDSEIASAPNVYEALALAFAHQIRRATRRGLLHGYITMEESLLVVRGRIRIGDQVTRRFGRLLPVEVRYDDFTHNIHENMLLRAALQRLSGLPVRSSNTRIALRHARAVLGEVAPVEYPHGSIPNISYTRLNEHYRPAVELAKLILRSTSFESKDGETRANAFLLNMDDVFEDFVYTALREALRALPFSFLRKATGKGLYLDEGHHVVLQPDLSWWDGKACLFIGDVKYKLMETGPPNADLYQLLAYATAAGLPGALLIYAATDGNYDGTYKVRLSGIELRAQALDLTKSPKGILAQVDHIAGAINSMTRAALRTA